MDSEPSRYAKSSRPVNSRTARPLPAAPEAVHPLVQQRLAAQRAKNRLGAPLAEQLRPQQQPIRPMLVPGGRSQSPARTLATTAAAVLGAASSVSLVIGGIQHAWPLAGMGAAGLLGAVGLAWAGRRWAPRTAGDWAQMAIAAPLWDEACIAALDQAIDTLAPVLPADAASALSAIKLQLARIQRQAAGLPPADEHFTVDDRLYLGELVRRYLPDTLHSYLAVPERHRDGAIGTQKDTATSLLLSQLQMLRLELDKKEAKLAHSRAENLLRQQRFLQSKASR